MNKRDLDSKTAKTVGEELMDGMEAGLETRPEVSSEERVEKPMLKNVLGVVFNTPHLNVREKPSPDGKVVCVIRAGASVEIDLNRSTGDFYRVTLAAGPQGYCSKKYITETK